MKSRTKEKKKKAFLEKAKALNSHNRKNVF